MSTPYDTGRVKIGLFYDPARSQQLSYSEEQVQQALLKWQQRDRANDSHYGVSGFGGDLHPLAEHYRKRAERKTKRVKRSVHKALRQFVAMMLSPRAPKL